MNTHSAFSIPVSIAVFFSRLPKWPGSVAFTTSINLLLAKHLPADVAQSLQNRRLRLLQMLFVEGNHFCPSCEKSGNCQLQATAYHLGMMSPHYDHFFPNRPVDASHPEVLLDFNRCILCSLCVRASRDVDGKNVFALSGRGINTHLIVNAKSGQLADTDFTLADKAAQVCPVGVILRKRKGFAVPIGERKYDKAPIGAPTATTVETEGR